MRAEAGGVVRPDLGGQNGELPRVVAERPRSRVEPGRVAIVVFGVVGELVWGALGTEVVGVRPSSVAALVGGGDDGGDQLSVLP